MKLAPWTRWKQTFVELVKKPLQPPPTTRVNRLGRRAVHEITIYVAEDNVIHVQHLALGGMGSPEVAIRMCWEAMQHFAMAAGVGLNLPSQAAVPAQVIATPQVVEAAVEAAAAVVEPSQNGTAH